MGFSKHLNGVHVNHSKNTAGLPIIPMPAPEKVYIPMSQHIGAPCTPVVKVGDAVKTGQIIGDSDARTSAPIHSSVSGTVEAITQGMTQAGKIDTIVVIKSDGKRELADTVVPPEINSFEEFVAAVRASGVVGLGGAGFPMGTKFNIKPGTVEYLIINGAECEPYITVDLAAMLEFTRDIIDGIRATMKWLQIPKCYIGIEGNKPDAIAKFNELLKGDESIKVHELRQIYPQGAERVIIYETTGRIVSYGMIPWNAGCIVANVTSMLKMSHYLKTGLPLVSKYITVDGDIVVHPQNVLVPIGTPIADVIDFCGGLKEEPGKIILGGPMMGRATPSDEYSVCKSNSAILCFSKEFSNQRKETACINCGRCVAACPMSLMPARISRAFKDKDVEALKELDVLYCMDCGSCAYVCPARKPLNFEFRQAKAMVMEASKK